MRSTRIADVRVFDGRSARKRRGVLFATEGIEWIGAHARAPKAAAAAREVDGAGKTLMPGLIDVHVDLQFDGSSDFEKESRDLTRPGQAAIKTVVNAKRNLDAGMDSIEHCNQLTAATAREMVASGTFRSPTICGVCGIENADRVPG